MRRYCLSLSSWFCVPEQGMQDFEILCRASAFLVPAKWGQSQFHVLTVSHGVAPWRWPKLYPDDWLQYVNEKHTHYTVEMRHIDGEFITQLDLKSRIYLHSHRDLAVMHFEEEDKALGLLKKLDLTTNLDFNCEDRLPADFSKELEFHGHKVVGQGIKNRDGFAIDDRKVIPMLSHGSILGKTAHQIFAKTNPVLVDGMCGGPVCLSKSLEESSNKIVCGLIEGIVPPDHPSQLVRSAAVFVENGEIRKLLNGIEEGRISPLVGGEAVDFVGKDQNPDKMDLRKLL